MACFDAMTEDGKISVICNRSHSEGSTALVLWTERRVEVCNWNVGPMIDMHFTKTLFVRTEQDLFFCCRWQKNLNKR